MDHRAVAFGGQGPWQATKLYLDICCLNRPFDDQTQTRIRLETESILIVLKDVQEGKWTLVTSDALMLENDQNPDSNRKENIQKTLEIGMFHVRIGKRESARAVALEALGFGAYDALHVSCAESAGAAVLLTTDDRFLKRAKRLANQLRTRVVNPVPWLLELRNETSTKDGR